MRLHRLLTAALLAGAVLLVPAGAASAAEAEEGHGELSHEAEECIHVLEEGGDPEDCHEAPSPILPEDKEIIWGGISFLVLFLLMAKFAYPAIQKAMDARTERIRSSLDEAESTRAQAQGVLEDYQRQLADARNEAARIIEEARQTADALKRDLTARAETEAAELRQRNAEQVAGERDRVMADLQGQVAVLAIELAEKVVESSLDRDANLRLIDSYIASLGNGGAAAAAPSGGPA